jgi:hypothetical protein
MKQVHRLLLAAHLRGFIIMGSFCIFALPVLLFFLS